MMSASVPPGLSAVPSLWGDESRDGSRMLAAFYRQGWRWEVWKVWREGYEVGVTTTLLYGSIGEAR
jgi:hypothetical protein